MLKDFEKEEPDHLKKDRLPEIQLRIIEAQKMIKRILKHNN